MKVLFSMMLFIGMICASNQGFSQEKKKWEEVTINVSVQCGMCKDRIEKALAYETGVIKSEVNLEKKVVVVKYKPSKTNPQKIRLVISKLGHDADDVPADHDAYHKLPDCCKKEGDACKH